LIKRAKNYILDVATEGLRTRVCGEMHPIRVNPEAT
jgi:hypothetical protein